MGGGADQRLVTVTERRQKKKKAQHIPEIFSAVPEYAWCSQIQAHEAWIYVCVQTHTHTGTCTHKETPTGLKIGQKLLACWHKK